MDSEGIDAVVEAIRALEGVEVTVVAPAGEQSGTGDSVTDPAPTTATEVSTASGYPALAVEGTPADSVNYALDVVFADMPPDLVISGSNDGQNFGPFATLSGTVGAARTAARQGVPAFAISQGGVTVDPEHSVGVPFLVEWFDANRQTVLDVEGDVAPVWSLNTPSCGGVGEIRGLLQGLPLAEGFDEGEQPFVVDCESTLEGPDDDVTAFLNGFATLTVIPEAIVLQVGR